MNKPLQPNPISPEEVALRRKTVSSAAWAARMEGLGRPAAEFAELDELWINGKISRDERVRRAKEMLKSRNG